MDDNAAETGSVSSQESYAFLNHSPSTVQDNLPPSVDDKPLARQKRKRTSPEDQAVLEAAYKRDPKPDKPARLELVKQVALGEKEVQIWFQNRRQSSRRKSRPLLPHEIAQYQMSRAGVSISPPESGLVSSENSQSIPEELGVRSTDVSAPERPSSREANDPVPDQLPPPRATGEDSRQPDVLQVARLSNNFTSRRASGPELQREAERPSLDTSAVGYLANRRSATYRMSDPSLYSIPVKSESDRKLKKSASVVRLSLNADGKAEIVTKNASSPSPPRPPQVHVNAGAAEPVSALPFPSLPAAKNLQRSTSGRSRDSRAWEFWCDKEARSELENAAAKESTGSAAGAIGLLRTASGRNVLGAIPSKRNSTVSSRHHDSVKRTKLGHKRPPLQRSHTSQGRLQGKSQHAVYESARPKLKHSESAASAQLKGSDSDKENWSPDPEGELGRSYTFDRQRTSQGRSIRHNNATSGTDPEGDPELAAFMGSSRKGTSVAAGDDLDCVQGLLSLSQGNWR